MLNSTILTIVIRLKNKTLSTERIHRVLAMIDDTQLEKRFFHGHTECFKANPPKKDEIEVVAQASTNIRRLNTAKSKKDAHIVSTWAARLGIALTQAKLAG